MSGLINGEGERGWRRHTEPAQPHRGPKDSLTAPELANVGECEVDFGGDAATITNTPGRDERARLSVTLLYSPLLCELWLAIPLPVCG